MQALRTSEARGLRPKELGRMFGAKGSVYRELRDLLRDLERSGRLLKLRGGRLAVPAKERGTQTGVLSLIHSGAGFVALDTKGPDVYVPSNALLTALHGDQVELSIQPARPGRRASGAVVRIVKRSQNGLVGVLRGGGGSPRRPGSRGPVVEVAGPGPSRIIRVVAAPPVSGAESEPPSPKDGDVVVLHLMPSTTGQELTGTVTEVLGRDTDPRTDSLRIIHQFGLSERFPAAVESEASSLVSDEPTARDAARVDRTHLHVLTIDPADARDHDDALSAVRNKDGTAEVGVHIADVAYYVTPGGAIDREARRRANTTYLVDRAVPMLPDVLSSDTCSLKVGKNRRALSLFFRVGPDGRVASPRLERTWVRPQAVLSYETAQRILEGSEVAPPATVASLRTLRDLAEILRIRRVNRGALDFDLPEAHVVLSADGRPVAIRRRLRLEAHRIIEEWMLAANEAIARKCREDGIPILYRVHEAPDPERMETLSALAATTGHTVPRSWTTRALQQLLDATRGQPEEAVIHNAVLRAMRRATYEARPSEHYGLAVEPYAHFTSPIRRYSDLHLHQMLDGTLLPPLDPTDDPRCTPAATAAAELATYTSERERVSDQAGRESIVLARLRYMEGRLGDECAGVISRVLSWGFMVALDETFVEGLVHVRTLADHYELHESSGMLVGTRRGLTFRDGDAVTIRVARVDRLERRIDFELVDGPEGTGGPINTKSWPHRRPRARKTRRPNR